MIRCAQQRRAWAAAIFVCLASLAMAATGCGSDEHRVNLHVEYGRQCGRFHADSINGTAVIAKMFEQAGHKVSARSALSPSVETADVIVWFPDDFDPPAEPVRRWFEDWLGSGYNRTLVYVGRDYDAEPLYWQKAIELADEQDRPLMRKRLEAAKVRVTALRPWHEDEKTFEAGWFQLTRTKKPLAPSQLYGDWSDDVDVPKTEIELHDRLLVYGEDEALLYTDDSIVAARVTRPHFANGQVLVVQNGSFLLNLPLVNHEHRQLAAELIAAVEQQSGDDCDVVFLESEEGGPSIHNNEPRAQPPTEADYPPPISDMLYHGIVLAILVAVGSWPIFGRARRLPAPPLSDFGQHVESLGDLLRRARDDAYCRERVAQWTERERR